MLFFVFFLFYFVFAFVGISLTHVLFIKIRLYNVKEMNSGKKNVIKFNIAIAAFFSADCKNLK